MFTDLDTGDTITVGPTCLAGFALEFAAGVTGDLAPELAEAYGQAFDQIRANDTRPESAAANGAVSGPSKPKPAQRSGRKPGTASSPSDAPPGDAPEPDTINA